MHAVALGVSLSAVSVARADANSEARLRDQLKQTITELRQLQDENIALKAKPPEPAGPPPAELQKRELLVRQSHAMAQQAAKDTAELRQQLEDSKKQLASAQAAATDGARQLRELGQRLLATSRDAEASQIRFDGCDAKNRQLTGLFDELLRDYSNRGVVDALLEREPLTGLKRAQLERLTDSYRTRAAAAPADAKPAAQANN